MMDYVAVPRNVVRRLIVACNNFKLRANVGKIKCDV